MLCVQAYDRSACWERRSRVRCIPPTAKPPSAFGSTGDPHLPGRSTSGLSSAAGVSPADAALLAAAITDLHAALLRRLAEVGRIHLHSARTNGDHIRDLRGDHELQGAVSDVVRQVERVQGLFGQFAVGEVV